MDYVTVIKENRSELLLGLGVFLCCVVYLTLRRPRHNLPPGPRGLPFLGYLPFVMKNGHIALDELRRKYGDIFGLNMAGQYVVVVSDIAITKELFNKSSASDRPPYLFESMPGGMGLVEKNGPEWVEQRRFTMTQMKDLGFGKSTWEKIIQTEVNCFLDLLSQKDGHPVDIFSDLSASLSNNLLSLATGHYLVMGDPRRNIIENGVVSFLKMNEQSGFITYLPKLFSVAVKLGLIRVQDKLKSLNAMNQYVRSCVEEIKKEEDGQSFIHGYLREIEIKKQTNSRNFFNDTNLTGNVQTLIVAGSDTVKSSLEWLLLAMATYPDIQDRLHAELDEVLGMERPADWGDRPSLPYCHAAILEGQRWRTVVPLNLLHRTNEDIRIRDYVIPKGADIMAFLWAFHMNPQHWENPEEFRPERWLTEDGKTVRKLENYAPFSIGKRICIGETVAHIEIFLYFARILQRFRILPESDYRPPDLEGISALVFQPKQQKLRYVPR